MELVRRRQILAFCGASIVAGCSARRRSASGRSASTGSGEWPTVGGDERNTGRVSGKGSVRDVTEQWSVRLREYPYTSPVVTDDSVFVHTNDGLLCIDSTGGERQWQAETAGKPGGTPAVADGTVVATADERFGDETDAVVRAFDAETGTERWATEVGPGAVFAPTIADGTVYVRGSTALHALALEDGREQWQVGDRPRFDPAYRDVTKDVAPAVAEGVVYAPDPDGIAAIRADDSAIRWQASIERLRSAPTVADSTVYASGVSSGISAFDVADGRERWSWRETGCWTSPAVGDSSLYATAGFDVVALDTDDGTEQWRTQGQGLHGDSYSSPALAGDTLVVGSNARAAVGLGVEGPRTGDNRWSSTTAGTRYSPAIADGTVYVVTERGDLLALG